MKWARGYTKVGSQIIGVIINGELHPRDGLGSDTAVGAPMPLSEVTLQAPVQPGKFIGLWNNFKAAAEKGGMNHPTHPLYFLKSDSSLSGHGSSVELPFAAGRVIFEGELGIVIGKTCKGVSTEKAAEAIFGYTCINDITSLDVLHADPSFPQWTRAKSFDGFGVVGPVIRNRCKLGGSYDQRPCGRPRAPIISGIRHDLVAREDCQSLVKGHDTPPRRPYRLRDIIRGPPGQAWYGHRSCD